MLNFGGVAEISIANSEAMEENRGSNISTGSMVEFFRGFIFVNLEVDSTITPMTDPLELVQVYLPTWKP